MLGRLFHPKEDAPSVITDKPTGLTRRLSALTMATPSASSPAASSPLPMGISTGGPQPQQQPSLSSPPQTFNVNTSYSNEDSYSRTVLYGTPNHLRCPKLEQFQYRLLIVQDKGELLQKNNYKTCFDSARDHHFDKAGAQKLENRHSTEELVEFMFGNPIHQDFAIGDRVKIHQLSPLKDLPHSMLVSRHFKVQKKAFALAVVIPVSSQEFSETILANWSQVSTHLQLIKSTFVENHVEKRNPAVATNYLDVAILYKQLVTSIHNLVSIPRLLLGVTRANAAMFQHWCYEMQNWLDIKDGAKIGNGGGTKFLISLLTIVLSVKNQLVRRDYSDEFVRVVIMASNPIVAQKLIFILSGVLPYELEFKVDEVEDDQSFKLSISTNFESNESKNSIPDDKLTPPTPSVISKGWEIPTTPSRSIATPSLMTPSRSSVIQPPLSTSQSMMYLSSSLQSHSSISTSFSRGFQLLQNWKNSLDSNSSGGSVQPQQVYRSPSPGNEYDEYPWTSQPSNGYVATTTTSATSLPRSISNYDLPTLSHKRSATVPKLPHVDRTTTNVFSIGNDTSSNADLLEDCKIQCRDLFQSPVDYEVEVDALKNVSVITVSMDNLDPSTDTKPPFQTPPPLCGYVNDFTPEFQLQACPISPDLESKIASAMKSDLLHYNNSRTIFVSLRAREVREFIMTKGKQEIKAQVKKLYYNGKPSSALDRATMVKVEQTMEALLSGKEIVEMVRAW